MFCLEIKAKQHRSGFGSCHAFPTAALNSLSSVVIPFEGIKADRNKYYEYGTLKVIVTASGRDHSAFKDLAPLYDRE